MKDKMRLLRYRIAVKNPENKENQKRKNIKNNDHKTMIKHR